MTRRAMHPWDELPKEGLAPAHCYAAQRDWPGYFAAVAGKPARETLLSALERFEREGQGGEAAEETSLAVDLGCGEGRDTAELLRRGWRVVAIDGHPFALELVRARRDLAAGARLELRLEAFEAVRVPRARLVNASFSLPFCRPEAFGRLWEEIAGAVEPGGRFAGQFFGERDGWAGLADRSHHRREEVLWLLREFEVEELKEEERDGKDAQENPKHWHVFHVVAKRLGDGTGDG